MHLQDYRFFSLFLITFFTTSSLIITPARAQEAYSKPSDIPAEAFAALPQADNLKQSPNGDKVAYMSSVQGRKVIIFQNTDGSNRYIQPPIGKADLSEFYWANNNRLLMVYEMTEIRNEYLSFRNTESRLAAVNADGSDFEWIVRPSRMKNSAKGRFANHDIPMFQNNIVDMLPDEPNHILLALDGDFNGQNEVRRVDIRDGKFKNVTDGFRGVQNWYTDGSGELRFAWGVWRETDVAMWKDPEGHWVSVADQDWYRSYGFWGLDATGNQMIVYAPADPGTQGVFKLDIATGTIVEEVFTHSEVNVDQLVRTRDRSQIVGVGYTVDNTEYHYTDRKRAGLHRAMKKALAGYHVEIVDFDHAAGKYLLFAYNEVQPGIYVQYDRKAKKLMQVATTYPGLEEGLMAQTQRINIPTSDNNQIPGYLTLPVGAEAKNLPLVVLVHGGPYARDDASWDYWAQFLASRGYAVLKPNFRGSDGYGRQFLSAGYNQWGGLMQRDVADATKFLIEQGIADSDRICIAGASYGGYAAMIGLIQNQDLYQCGVTVNGAVNLPRLKSADSAFWGRQDWLDSIGLEGHDLEDVSPFHQVKQITRPALVMASKDDTRLRIVDSENFYGRLKDVSPKSEYVEIEDGGHSMDTAASRLTKLKAMEAFLEKHIGR